MTNAAVLPAIGDLDDGGVYVGLSAEDGQPLHAALADLPEYKTYDGALGAARQLRSLHPTAHVPTPKELDKNLFANRKHGPPERHVQHKRFASRQRVPLFRFLQP